MSSATLARPSAEHTHILRAFATLMSDAPETLEARLALDVLAEAARGGAIGDVVKAIAVG